MNKPTAIDSATVLKFALPLVAFVAAFATMQTQLTRLQEDVSAIAEDLKALDHDLDMAAQGITLLTARLDYAPRSGGGGYDRAGALQAVLDRLGPQPEAAPAPDDDDSGDDDSGDDDSGDDDSGAG